MKVCILDYKYGNILSIKNFCEKIGMDVKVSNEKNTINNCDILILPGVGTFPKVMSYIKKKNLSEQILRRYNNNKLILGICIGMQIFCKNSYEQKKTAGLGIFKSEVKKINKKKSHIGWNKINKFNSNNFQINNKYFYFNHSYFIDFKKSEEKKILYFSTHNKKIPSIISKKNFFGVAFHPEKSQENGELFFKKLIENVKK